MQQHAAAASFEASQRLAAAAGAESKDGKKKKTKKKDKDQKSTGGRHRASADRPAFSLAAFEDRERQREADKSAAVLGAALLAPSEPWLHGKPVPGRQVETAAATQRADEKAQRQFEQLEQFEPSAVRQAPAEQRPADQTEQRPKKQPDAEPLTLDTPHESHELHEPHALHESRPSHEQRAPGAATPVSAADRLRRFFANQGITGEEVPPAGAEPQASEAAVGHKPYNEAETRGAYESPSSAAAAAELPEPPATPERQAGFDVPPVPPSFSDFERFMRGEDDGHNGNDTRHDGRAAASHRTAAPLAMPEPRPASSIPEGLQRTPADVSRAAWTGLAAGWWLGRRGKRKAVEQAHKAGVAAGRDMQRRVTPPQPAAAARYEQPAHMAPLEATPIHLPPHEAGPARVTAIPRAAEARPLQAAHSVAERPRSSMVPEARPTTSADRRPASPANTAAVAAAGEVLAATPEAEATAGMSRSELMAVAKKIKVDGVRLKDVFNAKRIDRDGLQAVVETYLRGGDYARQLSNEILAKEQSFERDPQLRHIRQPQSAGQTALAAGVSSAAVAARGLLQETGSHVAANSQHAAQKARKVLANGARQAQHDIIDSSNTGDWVIITAIVIVYALILLNIFT